MTKQDLIRKLTSRKFHAMLLALITGLLVLFGLDTDTITEVAALSGLFLTIMAYIFSEAEIDAQRIKKNREVKDEIK